MQDAVIPQQERSKKTLERILVAAEEAAAQGSFDKLSIRAICHRAGVTTGAFYARFQKKDNLALELLEVLGEEFRALVEDHLAQRESSSLNAAIKTMLMDAFVLYRQRGGLLHALMAKASSSRELAAAMRALNDETFSRLVTPPLPPEVNHPRPELGMRLALLCVFSALKELVLDQRLFENAPTIPDALLVDELSKIFLSYVTRYEA